jgi:hypothetical protein
VGAVNQPGVGSDQRQFGSALRCFVTAKAITKERTDMINNEMLQFIDRNVALVRGTGLVTQQGCKELVALALSMHTSAKLAAADGDTAFAAELAELCELAWQRAQESPAFQQALEEKTDGLITFAVA